ncbi:MAG: acyltransferase [Firmicutes bacterium]|nr:acyltransferase [Bacillota bacterium]
MRKYYLDNIRWITVVIVVIYHVFYMYNAEGIPGVVGNITGLKVQYYDIYQYLTYPWFMFLLFIVSGISSRCYLDNHTEKEFFRSRTTKLLVPSTIGLFTFQFIQGYFNTRSSDALVLLKSVPAPAAFLILAVSGIGVLWYIQLLWVFSVLIIPIRRTLKDRLWKIGRGTNIIALILLSVPVYGAAQILNTPIICVYRFGYYGLAFLLGYYVFCHDEVIEILKKWAIPLMIAAVILGIAFSVKYFGQNYADAPVYKYPLFTFFGWFASIAFLGAGAKYLDYTDGFTSWMNKHSWGLYIFHYLGISIIAVEIAARRLLPALPVYLLSLVSAFVTAFVLYELISRIPFFRWAVLGIGRKKKEKVNVQG